ncbi:peptide ABC transporter substrate-binding protein [Blastococcus sp. SYSU DS0617]
MKLNKRPGALALALAGAMLLSACGGGDDNGSGSGSGSGEGGGSFSLAINNPENPLVPGNTTETEGSQVVKALWTGLVQYAEDGEVEYTGVAESIESEDNITWTVTLNDGWTFHDGTPVTAQSFVDAWNYTAYSPNAQGASYFFSNIEGYDALQAETDDDGNIVAEPTATEMTGLEVQDDTTFTVTLTDPFAQFPVTVGYNAFFPMSEAFLEDPENAAQDTPIGNGPFQAEGPFEEGVGITLAKYEDYAGEDEAQADSVDVRVYSEIATSYRDVQGGNLDVVKDIPADAITTAPSEFGDRFIERPSSSFTYLGMPTYVERYSDPRVRQAISLAIDREAITDAIFNGTFTPADDAIAPVVDGYREGACEYCELDVERANQLLDEAGFDRSQPIELWFNAGASHDAWVEAVGNQLRENLGVDYTLQGNLEFAQYLPLADDQGFTGPFRLGWAMDYPSPQNYLEPLYSTAALPPSGSNTAFYSNPEFDELVDQGNRAESNEEAIDYYQQADDVLLEDMPILPMFFGVEQIVHSDAVSNVVIDVFGQIDVAGVTVTG